MIQAVAIDLDGALGDTVPLWHAFLEDAARRFRAIAPLAPDELPSDRGVAACELDAWASGGVGDWRVALERFAEDHAPVYLRPQAAASGAVRALAASGVRVGVFTDAPVELARVALAHFGVARRIAVLEAGDGSLERLLGQLGSGAEVARTPGDLARITGSGAA